MMAAGHLCPTFSFMVIAEGSLELRTSNST